MPLVVLKVARFGLQSDIDVVAARKEVTGWAKEIGLSVLDRTKVVTAASELARNTVIYGRGGTMYLEIVRDGARDGLRLTFEDQGPGISDIPQALEDGYSSAGSMGMATGGRIPP